MKSGPKTSFWEGAGIVNFTSNHDKNLAGAIVKDRGLPTGLFMGEKTRKRWEPRASRPS